MSETLASLFPMMRSLLLVWLAVFGSTLSSVSDDSVTLFCMFVVGLLSLSEDKTMKTTPMITIGITAKMIIFFRIFSSLSFYYLSKC